MSTATPADRATEAETSDHPGEQRILLADIGWDGFEAILAMKGNRRSPLLAYFQGSLELMSPGYRHETTTARLGFLVVEVAMGLNIACTPARATTLRRRDQDAGVEGDETFYIAHEVDVRGKDEINLAVDPPPDLAIEVEITHPLAKREAIYAVLGVPELWVYRWPPRGTEAVVKVLHLGPDGGYAEAPASLAFPFLQAREIDDWVRRPRDMSETQWLRQVRDWVRDVLAPRRAGEPGGERP